MSAPLRQILDSLSASSESSVSDLITFLDSLSTADDDLAKTHAFQALSQILHFITSPTLPEETADALSFELPRAASRLAGVSAECSEIAASVIDRLVSICNPRDMLSFLCEALAYPGDMTKGVSSYYVPLLRGISKVFPLIRRRHSEHVKTAVPVVLHVLKAVSLRPEAEETDLKDLFHEALSIVDSIKQICTEMEGVVLEKLRALLGLLVLQIMAIASFNKNYQISISQLIVTRLSSSFHFCGFSYLGLITGSDVDRNMSITTNENENNYSSCLSDVKLGASLSVIWGYIYDTVIEKEELNSIEQELKNDQTKRWQAIGTLKHALNSLNLPWKLKNHAVDFLLCITDENNSRNRDDVFSEYMPSIYAALQAVQKVIMLAPDVELRRNAFQAFKKILAEIHASQRLDMLKALIRSSDSSSMVAILLDIVRQELHAENSQKNGAKEYESTGAENVALQPTPFWNPSILKVVESVIRPAKGGPPELPEHCDSILSALNLYRFVLITESTGKTNKTDVMSKSNLRKALNEWLLPLRTLVTGVMVEEKSDYDQFAVDVACAINPMELVLYRCIELVEENLKQSL